MQLTLLRRYLAAFVDHLRAGADPDMLPYYETQRNWQLLFDLDTPDLYRTYDAALTNQTSRRIFRTDQYQPKRMMLLFLQQEPAFVRDAFRDLFNEDKGVENRIDRFVFYCDQFLDQYRRAHPLKIDANHYHDYYTNSLYLAFQYPARYAPYGVDVFVGTLAALGVRNLPTGGDYERHVKVCRTIYTFMEKEEGLLAAHQARLRPNVDYDLKSMLLVWEFGRYLAQAV